jgi:hypothetical protein
MQSPERVEVGQMWKRIKGDRHALIGTLYRVTGVEANGSVKLRKVELGGKRTGTEWIWQQTLRERYEYEGMSDDVRTLKSQLQAAQAERDNLRKIGQQLQARVVRSERERDALREALEYAERLAAHGGDPLSTLRAALRASTPSEGDE